MNPTTTITITLDQLSNGAWLLLHKEGHMNSGRPSDTAGFGTYEDAEKFAIKVLRTTLRTVKPKEEE